MIISAHQPNFIPYLGIIEKIRLSDVFVIRDDTQFSKRNFHHRQKFPANSEKGFKWITIPVEKKITPIIKVNIKLETVIKSMTWADYHLHFFKYNYKKSKYFIKVFNEIEMIYANKSENLRDFNMRFFSHAFKWGGIDRKVLYASELDLNPSLNGTDGLIEIVKKVGGKTYLSGAGAISHKNFFPIKFEEEKINLVFQKYVPKPYSANGRVITESFGYLDKLFWEGGI